jgi:hypothetical protein
MPPKHADKQLSQSGQIPGFLADQSSRTATGGSTVVCDLAAVWGFTADWSPTPVWRPAIRKGDPDAAHR